MGEILNFSSKSELPRNAVNDDGDVVPVEDYLSGDEQALFEAIHENNLESRGQPPLDFDHAELIYDVEALIEQQKSNGAHDDQIMKKVQAYCADWLIHMQRNGKVVDLSQLPVEWIKYDDPTPVDDIESADILTFRSAAEAREDKIERFMDLMGCSYIEASLRCK